MARATTKDELLKMANTKFEKLFTIINNMDSDKQNAQFSAEIENLGKEAHWKRDKNLRDILVHLFEWHQLLIQWEESNSKGTPKQFLKEGYNWKTYGNMNIEFWEKHQSTLLEQSKELLKTSHNEVIEMIDKYTDKQLFTKQSLNWTGTSTLGQYCVSATSSHYDWAIKKINKHIKIYQNQL